MDVTFVILDVGAAPLLRRRGAIRQSPRVARKWHRGYVNPANPRRRTEKPAAQTQHGAADADLGSDPAWPHRRIDRVPSRVVDRPSAAHRAFPRHLHAGQDLRGADPARRHPRHPLRLLRQADAHRHGDSVRSARAPLRLQRAAGVPAGGRDRCLGARFHQDGAVRDADAHRHHADRRRCRAADRRSHARSPSATTTRWIIHQRSPSRSGFCSALP